ncbi:formyltransferase family protein [Pseudoalteromonas sp. M8]|uniref:formyltransferase family protein n=1 Tax=Pseudoalteromonas sp. M8 TaxID=2692624 RepID=UPI001BA936C9|nr:formyltransferase family protein [Pseudoalteromonas sp. M8]QUI69743.1 hypothetical protein GSF13_08030 [Pseudoalteromonas sp. M8]
MKIVFICSTNGSVIKKALSTSLLASYDIEFVSDRPCGLIEFAEVNNLSYKVLPANTGSEFSILLTREYPVADDILFVSFYTRLLSNVFLKIHSGKVINFHPSILPACPGMDGFGDTLKSGALFIGSTAHFIDEGMDTGLPVLQAAFPKNAQSTTAELRHRVFLQQVISLLQLVDWFSHKRVHVANGNVDNATYEVGEFSPNLDQKYSDIYNKWIKQI